MAGRRDKNQTSPGDLETVALFVADRAEQAGRIIQEGLGMNNTHQYRVPDRSGIQIIAQFAPMVIPIDAYCQGIYG